MGSDHDFIKFNFFDPHRGVETNFEFDFYENLMAEALCEWGCCQLGSPSHGGTPSSAIGPGPWWSLQKAGVIATDLTPSPPPHLLPPKYTPAWRPKTWCTMENLSFGVAWPSQATPSQRFASSLARTRRTGGPRSRQQSSSFPLSAAYVKVAEPTNATLLSITAALV